MPVDTSMYGMIRPIDAAGAVEGGMRMRDMIDERKKKSAIQGAYKQGMQVGPDGKVAFDSNLTASALAQGGYGEEAYQVQQRGQSEQQKQMEMHVKRAQFGAQMLSGAENQAEWDYGLQQIQNSGMDATKLPGQFSLENQKMVTDSATTLGDRLQEQFRQQQAKQAQNNFNTTRADNRQDKLDARDMEAAKAGYVDQRSRADHENQKELVGLRGDEARKTAQLNAIAGKGGGHTEGEKKVDQDYAKDYNDFTGGGYFKAQDGISKLKDFRAEMANDTGWFQAGGGPMSGSMPDALRTESSISRRDNIVSVANSALKATFGGALSDGERKALSNEFYNDKLSNAKNMEIIDRKIQELESGIQAQIGKAKHYQSNRSLKGFQYENVPRPQQAGGGDKPKNSSLFSSEAHAGQSPKVFNTNEVDWMPE